jgi:GT2 family glycosyltransferase/glycosyltransferase involved in cell wall biosynthesis
VTLNVPDDPEVSVVMVLYGGWKVAQRAISALAENAEPRFELILVDNASPDDTLGRIEEHVDGATVLRNTTNTGFGPASNQGAALARGRTLCFLNSDALVEPGWLPPLVETLAGPGVGAVVPLFLNENGTVQEAGSVVDAIGHAHAVGGDGDPRDFQYRFPREADFGSAACMLVPADLFLELGGFDELFAPAYFEDTDLCFRLHERGLKTIFEPRSRVVHMRHGSGTSESARKLMEEHRDLFVERWGERLTRRPRLVEVAQKPNQMLAARDAEALDRILVIDDRVPFTDRGSGDPRMAALLAELAALWPSARITFLASHGTDAERYAEPLLRSGIEVVAPPVDWEAWFEARRIHYGVVLVSRQQNVEAFRGFLSRTQPQALRVFDTEALTFLRLERLAEILPAGKQQREVRAEAAKTRAAEILAVQDADAVFCVSKDEARFVAEVAPGKPSFVLPGIVDAVSEPTGFDERSDLLFFGGFLAGAGSPNEDALLHLVSEVMPILWERDPELRLHVVGADPTPAVEALHGERINVVGYVADPAEWLARTRVHLSPMRFGSGIKLKLLDTIAAGQPFVTTAVGAEGLSLGPLRSALVGEEPDRIAELAYALYTDERLWVRAQNALLDLARSQFDRDTFRGTLVEAMSHLGMLPPEGVFGAVPREAQEVRLATR